MDSVHIPKPDAGDGPITVMSARRVKPGCEEELEAALKGMIAAGSAFVGHMGATVFRPDAGTDVYRIVFKFDRLENLQVWETSAERGEWLARIRDLTVGDASFESLSGLETWFTLPGARTVKPPPRPKMATLTWLALFPMVSLLLWALGPVLAELPFLLRTLVLTGLVTGLMTWVVMPRLTRLFARWLFG
ncbi:MAG: antibiotic biosynthesis monooxygenase [Rhodospirillaceae bacterium]|nr:antibiotic biosynthesis monooxygenase [Rhodospirillaceae bacterium]